MRSASDAESWRWLQLVDLKQPQEKTKKRLKHGCCSSVRFYHFYQNLLVLLRIFVSNTLCATWKSTSITKSQIIKAVKLIRNHGPSVASKMQKKKKVWWILSSLQLFDYLSIYLCAAMNVSGLYVLSLRLNYFLSIFSYFVRYHALSFRPHRQLLNLSKQITPHKCEHSRPAGLWQLDFHEI